MRTTIFPGWGFIVAAMAIYLFYAISKTNRSRREHRHERFKEKQDELLRILKEKHNNEQNPEGSDTTGAE